MIHWHSLLTQRSPQQGAFPGKTSGPLFVDATLLIQPAAWFRNITEKLGKTCPGHVSDAGQRFDGRGVSGISSICCITAPRRGCRSKLRMFFSVLTCAIHSRTARVKNVAQIWLHSASTPGIADLDSCCKNGIASLSQLYSTLWLTGAKNSVSGKDVKNNAPNVATEECRRQYRSIHYRHDSGDELNFVVAGPHFPGVM